MLSIDVGVIGPFEEGFLRRSERPHVQPQREPHQGRSRHVNGDKNGLFELDPMYNEPPEEGADAGHAGRARAEGRGNVQEVIAPNVEKEDVLFPDSVMAKTANPNPNPNPNRNPNPSPNPNLAPNLT